MEPLLTSEEMQAADRLAIEKGLPAILLMEHAAQAAVDVLKERFKSVLPLTKGLIVAGRGNNGGDAIAVARILHQSGIGNIEVVLAAPKEKCQPLCRDQIQIAENIGMRMTTDLKRVEQTKADWIVDGVFGTGLSRNVDGVEKTLIDLVNARRTDSWILSLDVPSGLSSNTGRVMGTAVHAAHTISFGFYKRGLMTGQASDYVGKLSLADIQIPREAAAKASAFLYDALDAKKTGPRPRSSHKGTFGHVYVLNGASDKEGAGIIASLGALRSGAGLVTVLNGAAAKARLPVECMVADLSKLNLEKTNGVFVVGPGMGVDDDSWRTLTSFLKNAETLVLDADALTLISEHEKESLSLLAQRAKEGKSTLLTPHPKEAARLLQCSVEVIEQDRYQSIRNLTAKFPGTILLKGRGTLISNGKDPIRVVNRGDSGLAKGGSGDLLSGIIAAALAQGLEPIEAVSFAVYCHARSSELLTQKRGTERSSIATELAQEIPEVFKELEL